jgi:hypothetical protein
MRGERENFCMTTSAIAAAVNPPCAAETVRLYADEGWVECLRLPNGTRLFKPSAAAEIRSVLTQRMANRGGDRSARA